jgi:hypothetical protein
MMNIGIPSLDTELASHVLLKTKKRTWECLLLMKGSIPLGRLIGRKLSELWWRGLIII